MRRRITQAIVGVAALILLMLGIPLAIAVRNSILNAQVVKAQADTARALVEVRLPLKAQQLASMRAETDDLPPFAVYDSIGIRVFGTGPNRADPAVQHALGGSSSTMTAGAIVVAMPIVDDTTELTVGALRVERTLDGVEHRAHLAWMTMGAATIIALIAGWIIASRLARRLSLPIIELAEAAALIGASGTPTPTAPTGFIEIDNLSTALSTSAQRVNEALAREHRFSADVSHQLRTPLTGLRLHLESERHVNPSDSIAQALRDLDRIDDTVEHLLEYARDAIPASATTRLDAATQEAQLRWQPQAIRLHRSIKAVSAEEVEVRAAPGSIQQVLDVLIDNALNHGTGTIVVSVRRMPGGAAIDVTDEGRAIGPAHADIIFERGHGVDNGIGLALARSIVEANGGRLLLASTTPTTFSVVLLQADQG